MSKYDVRLRDVVLNGIAVTKYGETVCAYTRDGDFTEVRKGAKGDAITNCLYGTIDRFRVTVHFDSPIWSQVESWAKNHTYITLQCTDDNTGEKITSTTATIQNLQEINDGQDREFNVHCEEVA